MILTGILTKLITIFLIKLYEYVAVILQYCTSHRRAQVMENRKRLIPIIECVLLCGREEIPLRGHCDSGNIVVNGIYANYFIFIPKITIIL